VRQFYWCVQDLFASVVGGKLNCETITGNVLGESVKHSYSLLSVEEIKKV